jgi:hypothetical protein
VFSRPYLGEVLFVAAPMASCLTHERPNFIALHVHRWNIANLSVSASQRCPAITSNLDTRAVMQAGYTGRCSNAVAFYEQATARRPRSVFRSSSIWKRSSCVSVNVLEQWEKHNAGPLRCFPAFGAFIGQLWQVTVKSPVEFHRKKPDTEFCGFARLRLCDLFPWWRLAPSPGG